MHKYILSVFIIMIIFMTTVEVSAQSFTSTDAVETTSSGSINWTTGEIYATGIGVPPASAVNPAQARAMTERAALVVAYRNLLEAVKGVRVDSETVVENMMVKSDVIRTRVDGIVKGARVVKKQYLSDGAVEVLVSMPMKGAFLNAVVPENFGSSTTGAGQYKPYTAPQKPAEIKPQPKPEPQKPLPQPPVPAAPEKKTEPAKPAPVQPAPIQPAPLPEKKAEPAKQPEIPPAPAPRTEPTVAFKGGAATGLVIDGRGLGLKPALLPKIFDPQGQEVYVGQVVTRTNAVEAGVAGYAKDVNAAANNFRVTDNPVVIKGQRASGSARTDIVLGQADAQSLRQLSGKGDFLQYCRVIIVY